MFRSDSIAPSEAMPPKPQTWKSPDGQIFTSKPEYRDYMMAKYYSFKNIMNVAETQVKKPGDVDGQPFDIADCEGSSLVVMDVSDQVQIDSCKKCRIFIGACSSAMFIRNCEDCVFYTCCQQLRLRDVTRCTFYIYSYAEVHIEFTNNVMFAPFNGGYPEQAAHLQRIGHNVNHNLWYDIFDHNDADKNKSNWSLLSMKDYEAPWFPANPCTPAIPITTPGSVAKTLEGGQVGQAFGVDQMRADQAAAAGSKLASAQPPAAPDSASHTNKKPPSPMATSKFAQASAKGTDSPKESKMDKKGGVESPSSKGRTSKASSSSDADMPITIPSTTSSSTPLGQSKAESKDTAKTLSVAKELKMEIPLLIASASAKGIDVSIFLSENVNGGKVPLSDFNNQFVSLGLTVGMGEEWDTKSEIEIATSSSSLKDIESMFGQEIDKATGKKLVNVTAFLSCCRDMINAFMAQAEGVDVDDDDMERPIAEKEAKTAKEEGAVLSPSSKDIVKSYTNKVTSPSSSRPSSSPAAISSSSSSSSPYATNVATSDAAKLVIAEGLDANRNRPSSAPLGASRRGVSASSFSSSPSKAAIMSALDSLSADFPPLLHLLLPNQINSLNHSFLTHLMMRKSHLI